MIVKEKAIDFDSVTVKVDQFSFTANWWTSGVHYTIKFTTDEKATGTEVVSRTEELDSLGKVPGGPGAVFKEHADYRIAKLRIKPIAVKAEIGTRDPVTGKVYLTVRATIKTDIPENREYNAIEQLMYRIYEIESPTSNISTGGSDVQIFASTRPSDTNTDLLFRFPITDAIAG